MTIDFSTKPKIILNLHPVFEAFLRLRFRTPRWQSEIVVSRSLREGKAIYAKIKPVEFPPVRPFMENPVTIILPLTKFNQSTLNFKFFALTKMAEEQLNDDLDVLLDKFLFKVFQKGYRQGFTQKQIVEGIMHEFNLRKNSVNFDTIKKYDYRARKKSDTEIANLIFSHCRSVS